MTMHRAPTRPLLTSAWAFHRFTIGHAWVSDYGDVSKPEDFEYIYAYSPLHNVRVPSATDDSQPQQYPAMILTTGQPASAENHEPCPDLP